MSRKHNAAEKSNVVPIKADEPVTEQSKPDAPSAEKKGKKEKKEKKVYEKQPNWEQTAKVILEKYEKLEKEYEACHTRMVELTNQKIACVKELVDCRGNEPFKFKGTEYTPVIRDKVYYFRSPRKDKKVDELG